MTSYVVPLVPLIAGIIVVLALLVGFLAWRSHVKHRAVNRTNDRLNQGH